jgi:3-oxoadipate enol-lactonase
MPTPLVPSPAYTQRGKGRTFLYIAGIEGTGQLFYKQIEDLSRDHQVITFPFRPDGLYNIEQLIEDVEWILKDAGAVETTVLGESFGGLLTIATALARPELFSRIILLNTFPWFQQRAKINLGVALFSILPYSLFKAYRTRRSRDELFSEDISDEDRRKFHELTQVVSREGYLSRLRIIRDTDFRERVKQIQIPALVIAGSNDQLFDSVGYGRFLSSRMPRAKLKILDGTGHVALLAEGVRVRDWLAELDEIGSPNSGTTRN